jgi:hypothetical protein
MSSAMLSSRMTARAAAVAGSSTRVVKAPSRYLAKE